MKIKEVEYTENYIMVRMEAVPDPSFLELGDAEQWCMLTGAGKRVNRFSFAFKTDAEFLMFKLKWL